MGAAARGERGSIAAQGQLLQVPAALQPVPVSQAALGHVAGVVHAVAAHVTLQPHDEAQDTPRSQLLFPVQLTVQAPAPHATPLVHELVPVQLTEQLDAFEQSTLRQESTPAHAIWQAIPAGHAIAALRQLLPAQSMVQSA